MKKYRVCIQSWLSNNSDYSAYNVYIFKDESELEIAKTKAKQMINRWNKLSKGIIYNLFSIEEI